MKALQSRILTIILLTAILIFLTRSTHLLSQQKSPLQTDLHLTKEQIYRKIAISRIPIEPLGPGLRSPKWDPVTAPLLVEDRSHLSLLATHLVVPRTVRKIYIDFGLQVFDSSIQWMEDNYPMRFDQIYGFEAIANVFAIPEHLKDKYEGRFHFYNKFVTTYDSVGTIDAVRFLQETIEPADFVVIKMDIEGEEWNVLPKIEDAGLFSKIDEFFVELHFKDPIMQQYHWDDFKNHTMPEAKALIEKYRAMGVYAHYWP